MKPQNILIIYAHPEPKSMSSALFQTAIHTFEAEGHLVQFSDLYKMKFNPTSGRHNFTTIQDPHSFKQQAEEVYATEMNGFAEDIEAEIRKIEWCDLMIWQFPLWWFSVPGILKGWVDRVFAMGRTFGNGRFYENGVFKGKKAMLSITTGSGQEAYLSDGFQGDLMSILRHIHRGMLQFTGFTVLQPHVVYSPARKSSQELEAELKIYSSRLRNIWKESPLNVGRY